MATDDSKPKRSGLGWIPKLSLWAVVIAFGYLYLSSIDRDSSGDSAQLAAADLSGTPVGAQVVGAEVAGAGTGAEADGGGLTQQLMSQLDELTSSAGTLIGDATTAGTEMFKGAVEKVKDLAGLSDDPVAETTVAETRVAEPMPAQPAVVQSPVAVSSAAQEANVTAAVERPPVSAFERHSAPLPNTSIARPASQTPEAVAVVDAPAAPASDVGAVADTEASVFAESLMRADSTAETVSASASADATSPTPSPSAVGSQPAPLMPVQPQPFGPFGAWTEAMPTPAAIEAQQAAAAEYRARMMAEYENRRRLADQRAREYWDRMQDARGQVAPPMGYPAYAPGYGPGYGPSAFQR